MIDRKFLIIGLVLFVGIPVVVFVLFLVFSDHSTKPITTIKDRDTGEVVISDPNKGVEDASTNFLVLGMTALNKPFRSQIVVIKESISSYAINELKRQFPSVTLIPADLKDDGAGHYSTKLRLGQTDETVSITITATNTGETQVIITDSSKKYPNYDSGTITIRGG